MQYAPLSEWQRAVVRCERSQLETTGSPLEGHPVVANWMRRRGGIGCALRLLSRNYGFIVSQADLCAAVAVGYTPINQKS